MKRSREVSAPLLREDLLPEGTEATREPTPAAEMAARASDDARARAASPPSSSLPAAPRFLPRDILVILMGILPLAFRLRVASRVCKTWRSAALGSIASHTLYGRGEVMEERLPPMLSSLQHLELHQACPPNQPLMLPASLTSLTLRSNCACPIAEPCPALVRLDLEEGFGFAGTATLLTASAHSLQDLSLHLTPSSVGLMDVPQALHFPLLRSLKCVPLGLIAQHLLRHHCTQLTHLGIGYFNNPTLLQEWSFPSLTSLTAEKSFVHHYALSPLLARAPHLTSLSLSTPLLSSAQLRALVAPLVTDISYWSTNSGPISLVELGPLTRLSRIDTFVWEARSTGNVHELLPRFGAMIVKLEIGDPGVRDIPMLLRHCSNITELRIVGVKSMSLPPAVSRLPRLTTLSLALCADAATLHLVQYVGSVSPALRRISVLTPHSFADGALTRMCDACPRLESLRVCAEVGALCDVRVLPKAPAVRVLVGHA